MLNPRLALRCGESWNPVYDAMRVRQMAALGLGRYVAAVALIEEAERASALHARQRLTIG